MSGCQGVKGVRVLGCWGVKGVRVLGCWKVFKMLRPNCYVYLYTK
jgi:hypothetical protein